MTADELQTAYDNFMAMLSRLVAPATDEEMARLIRLMTTNGPVLLDLGGMIDAALDERDRAREAAARLERIDPKSYTLNILRGTA